MAGRPPKESLDFAGWAVDIFDNEPKIDKLIDAQGCAGFVIYFFLCQRAYGSNGYFYPWSYDDAATTARKIGGGVGSETVKQTVGTCLQIGLFDKRLFDRNDILTSRGIQKRYMQVALTRTNKSVITEYWLLTKEESVGLNFRALKSNFQVENANYDAPKSNNHPQKERKEKESKDISNDISTAEAVPYKEIIDYLNSKTGKRFQISKTTRSHIKARWGESYRLNDFKAVIDNRVVKWKDDIKMREYLQPSTLFGTKFENYLNDCVATKQTGRDLRSRAIEKGVKNEVDT